MIYSIQALIRLTNSNVDFRRIICKWSYLASNVEDGGYPISSIHTHLLNFRCQILSITICWNSARESTKTSASACDIQNLVIKTTKLQLLVDHIKWNSKPIELYMSMWFGEKLLLNEIKYKNFFWNHQLQDRKVKQKVNQKMTSPQYQYMFPAT